MVLLPMEYKNIFLIFTLVINENGTLIDIIKALRINVALLGLQ